MTVTRRRSVLAVLALGLSADILSSQSARPTPPPTRRDDVREVPFLAGELGIEGLGSPVSR